MPRPSQDLPPMLSAPKSTSGWVSPRRPFTVADTPSSPASSTASQKFEVKRLLSRPADPASLSSPRPLTTFIPSASGSYASTSQTVPIVPLSTLKRSNSAGRSLLKRRPSRTHVDPDADSLTPKQHAVPLPSNVLPDPAVPPTASTSMTPASAYAREYAQRTNMAISQTKTPPPDPKRRPSEFGPRPRRPSENARHPFEHARTGRVVAVGDPSDETLILSGLALAGFGAPPVPGPSSSRNESGLGGLTRKVSARFRRRKNSIPGPGIQSDEGESSSKGKDKEAERKEWQVDVDAGREEWCREKERVGLRRIGLSSRSAAALSGFSSPAGVSPAGSSPRLGGGPRVVDTNDATIRMGRKNRGRQSRHLSIEDFRGLVRVEQEGASFEMWTSQAQESERGRDLNKEKMMARKRSQSLGRKVRRDPVRQEEKQPRRDLSESVPHRDDSHLLYKDISPVSSRKEEIVSKRAAAIRSNSAPETSSPPESIGPESRKGGKLWRLVKKMSTGTLKEKKYHQAENAPPVPPLPSSRRSSVLDYGDELRPDLARLGTSRSSFGRSTYYESSSTAASIHSGPSSISGHAIAPPQPQPQPQPQPRPQSQSYRHRSASGGRPSLATEWRPSMTNDSSVVSTSPKSSFGRALSPRTSMSSYVDLGDEIPPPLPLVKHIVSPGELAQYTPPHRERVNEQSSSSVGASPSLPPPKRPRAAQKPRDKSASNTPLASPMPGTPDAPVKPKPKPNVLRRPTRLASDGLNVPSSRSVSVSPRSPRSASMGMPSPRPRPQTQEPVPTRPRSNSLGTLFTFREIGECETRGKLTEQEKVAKFEQLLEASDKAGGTLHARVQDRLLSDTMRMSGNFDASSVSGL